MIATQIKIGQNLSFLFKLMFYISRYFWCAEVKNKFKNKKYYFNIILNRKHFKK